MLADSELLEEIVAGRTDALDELYDRYAARAFRVARSTCRDDGAAEDAVQEAFVSIFRRRMTYRSERGTVAAWLLTVVLDRAIDVTSAPGDVADQAAAPVRTALAALPEEQREAITLAYYGELAPAEIAERLGVPFGTVKGRIRLGMNKLALALERTEYR